MGPSLPMLLAIAAAVVLATLLGALLLTRRRREVLASVTLSAPGQFALELPPTSRPIEIAIRFGVAFPYFKPPGLPVQRRFGLVVELELDGERLVFGKGGDHPASARDFEGLVESMTIWAPGSDVGPSRYTATQTICRRPGSPRVVRGTIHVAPGTTLEHATIVVS